MTNEEHYLKNKEYKRLRHISKKEEIHKYAKAYYESNKAEKLAKKREEWKNNLEESRSLASHRKRLQNVKRRDIVNNFKIGKSCKCGESRVYVLDFHHRDPSTKLFELGSATKYSIKKINEEMLKCDLLCRNCHAELHYLEDKILNSE